MTMIRLKKQDVRGRLLTLTLHVTPDGSLMLNIGVTAKQTGRGEAKSIVTADALLTSEDAAALAVVLAEHTARHVLLAARAALPLLPFDADDADVAFDADVDPIDPATLMTRSN